MEKTKICHITTCHEAEDGRIFKRECQSLAELYDVSLIFSGNEKYEKGNVHLIGVPIKKRWNKLWLFFKQLAFVDYYPMYKKALELDCELYQFHDPEFLFYAKKLQKRGKKVIFDSHENYKMQYRVYLKKWPKFVGNFYSYLFDCYQGIVLKKIDAVIFPALRNGKHPFEGRCKRVAISNNLPKLEEYYDRFKDDYLQRGRKVCYIGSLTAARGIREAVLATFGGNAQLVLGGEFHDKEFQRSLEGLAEYKHVDYRGFLNVEESCNANNECRIGLATILNVGQYNQYDNLPSKAYEYMALGIPIILTESHYNSMFIEKYKCGICVDPTDIKTFSKAISDMLDNEEKSQKMGNNGRIAVNSEFNWDLEKIKLFELYVSVLNEKN